MPNPTMYRLGRPLAFLLFLASATLSPFSQADYTRVEETHASVSLTGNWQRYESATVSGGSVVASGQPGARATITFTGNGIRWVSYGCECAAGPAHVYLDGKLQVTTTPVPAWADIEPKLEKFRISGLANGTHTLTIEVADNLPGWAGPTVGTVAVDAFYVERANLTRTLEENDIAITYAGNWIDMDDPSVSGGSILATNEPGATATIRFNGTGLSWVGYRCPCTGLGRASFDALGAAVINTYAAATEPQATVHSITGAANGEHQLKIEAGGSSSGGPWLAIDAFRVFGPDDADTTPPEVAIRAPAEGQRVYGAVRIITDVFDNANLYGGTLNYYVDGVPVQIPRPNSNPRLHDWFTTDFSDGPHELTVIARDLAGNETRSAPVRVIVDNANAPDWTPPAVTLTAPLNNSQITGVVTLSANATDNVGVTRVTFHAGLTSATTTLLAEDTTAPYSITGDTSSLPNGQSYYVKAMAYDAAGNVASSSVALITVRH